MMQQGSKRGLPRRFRLRSLSYGGQVAPRNDEKLVIPRACGVSSTLQLLDSIIGASGILDHPLSRMMTARSKSVLTMPPLQNDPVG
jgi:hypothetical protein